MYFISRNNAIYNCIAHTSTMRRYIATLFIIITAGAIGLYGVYVPLRAHITLAMLERTRLRKQCDEIERMREANKELLILIDADKKSVNECVLFDNQQEQDCSKHMQFVFDTIAQLGLVLNSYNMNTVQDKKWYTKEGAHIQVNGSLEKIISFFKTVKDSESIMRLSRVVITRLKDDVFQLSCDAAIVVVKS